MIRFFAPDAISADKIAFSVVAARLHGEWIFCRRRDRDTWEMPGGHIESGETPEEAAARELREETGCACQPLIRVADYRVYSDSDSRASGTSISRTSDVSVSRASDNSVSQADGDSASHTSGDFGYGALFFAEVESVPHPDPAFEMAEVALSALPPRNQTYPDITPALFHEVQSYLNRQTSSDELWDVLDLHGNPTGRLHRRIDPLAAGEYHLVVQVWIRNAKGEYLLTRRAPNKGYSLLWETVGGSAIAGDESLSAAIREVREETGLILRPESGRKIETRRGEGAICDVWLFESEFDLSRIVLQAGETCAARSADAKTLVKMRESGMLVSALPACFDYKTISNMNENK